MTEAPDRGTRIRANQPIKLAWQGPTLPAGTLGRVEFAEEFGGLIIVLDAPHHDGIHEIRVVPWIQDYNWNEWAAVKALWTYWDEVVSP